MADTAAPTQKQGAPLFTWGVPNLGGPGWIHPVFDASIVLDEDRYAMTRQDHHSPGLDVPVKCFDMDKMLTGRLIIEPPPGRTAWHGEIKLYIKSTNFIYDRDDDVDVFMKEWVLMEAGYMSEPTEIPFEIALANVENLRETYDGSMFLLRHFIGYSISRPFYTFRIWDEKMIVLMKSSQTPAPSATQGSGETQMIEVNDFGGKCKLTHQHGTYSLRDTLKGEVEFHEMTDPDPISQVEIILGRTETYDHNGKEHDVEVRKFIVHKDSIVEGPITIPFSLPLIDPDEGTENAKEKLLPSLPALNKLKKDGTPVLQCQTEYWLRMVLKAPQDAAAWWSSQPLTLIRTAENVEMKGSAAVA